MTWRYPKGHRHVVAGDNTAEAVGLTHGEECLYQQPK